MITISLWSTASAVFVCASGQIWTAARTSSELRDSFASVLCHCEASDCVTQRYARATLAAMREALDGLEALLLEEGK